MPSLLMLAALLVATSAPAPAPARADGQVPPVESSWATDSAVGPNEVDITVTFDCTGNPYYCLALDGYSSSRTTALSGSGVAALTEGGSWEIGLDKYFDPIDAWVWLLEVEDVQFDPIGIIIPRISDAVVFGTGGGPFDVPGLTFEAFGPVVVGAILPLGVRFNFNVIVPFPTQVLGPEPGEVTGIFEMIDATHYEVRDLNPAATAQTSTSLNPGTLTVTVDLEFTAHFAGDIGIRLTVDRTALHWSDAAGAVGYDVVSGSLGGLLGSGGDFSSAVQNCVQNDYPGTTLGYTAEPSEAGECIFLLVRGVQSGGNLTYDSSGGFQIESRDAEIEASGSACP